MPAAFRSISIGGGEGPVAAVDRPSPISAGDVLWALHATLDPWEGIPAPPGWTAAGTLTDDVEGARGLYARVWKRTLTGGIGAATYNFAQSEFTGGLILLVATSGVSNTIPVQVRLLEGAAGGNNVPTPTVPPAASSHLELRFALALTDGELGAELAGPAGYVLRGGTQYLFGITVAAATKQLNSSAPSGAKNFSAGDAGVLVAHGVTISIPSADAEPDVDPIPAFTPAQGSALYQYPVRRLLDRAYLGHLDLSGVSMDKRVSSAGTFGATVPITSEAIGDQIDKVIPRDRTQLNRGPGVISVEVIRGGEYVCEYWIHGAKINKQRRKPPTLTLRGSTVDAYLQHLMLREAIGELAADEIDHARMLLEYAQGLGYSDIGLHLQDGTSGVERTQGYEPGNYFGPMLTGLADRVDGFEWTVNTVAGTTGSERHWVWGKPLGDPAAKHVFGAGPSGGDILDWDYDIDALKGGTHWDGQGDSVSPDASTTAQPLLSAVYESTPNVLAGHPRIDRRINRPGVTRQETLEEYAAGWAEKKGGAVTVFSVTVAIGEKPSFLLNNLGDAPRFILTDEWHKKIGNGPGRNSKHRVIGGRVIPVGREQGKDELQMFVEETAVI